MPVPPGWDSTAQKTQLSRRAGMAVLHEAEMAAEQGRDFDAQAVSRAVSEGSPAMLRNFAFACGRDVKIDNVAQDMMAWATPGTAADIAALCVRAANFGGIAAGSLLVQRLGEMRAAQPEGPLSR